MKKEARVAKKSKSKAGKIISTVGIALIVIVIALCSLMVLPKVFGYQAYHVLSGSMEPEMPVGSLVYVQKGNPEEVKEDDVIAFYSSLEDGGIITHRVTKNNVVSGTFQTKGDANEKEDPLPVSYDNYIGTAAATIPHMGKILTVMSSMYGKIAAVCVILLGVALNVIGSFQNRNS
ncbi:MAG: signal peptidase I [Eubacterium sp.]|nr:signal peptidase I [Eubacterium sp.]